jgi:single-strand DNA-binding protein
MGSDINMAVIGGRLTRDPELRYTPQGTAVCNFSIASSDYIPKGDGQFDKVTIYKDCVAWKKTAEDIAKYYSKGSPIVVTGKMTERTWEKDGVTHKKEEIRVDRRNIVSTTGSAETKAPEEHSDVEPF